MHYTMLFENEFRVTMNYMLFLDSEGNIDYRSVEQQPTFDKLIEELRADGYFPVCVIAYFKELDFPNAPHPCVIVRHKYKLFGDIEADVERTVEIFKQLV
jgi:hypothetical protein